MMSRTNRVIAAIVTLCLLISVVTAGGTPAVMTAYAAWDGVAATSLTGSGTATSPYLIKTTAQMGYVLQKMREGVTFSGSYLKLMANLDMTGGNWDWTGIGTEFQGDFNGNGYTLTLDKQFMNIIGQSGRIRQLHVVGTGNIENGMICSHNQGVIDGCTASGTVYGDESYAGGLVYENSGTMHNVGFVGTVGGPNMDVGGLVFRNTGIINNGYAAVTLDAYSSGKYGASSEDAVAKSNSGTISNVYYDSAKGTSAYGTPISADEMKTQAFVDMLNLSNPSLATKFIKDSSSVNGGLPLTAADLKSSITCSLSHTTSDTFICSPGTSVTITKSNTSGTIYYTTDGTNPTSSSTRVKYTGAFTIGKDMTIKMVAYDSGYYGVVRAQKAIVMDGQGTNTNPYKIKTAAHLSALAVAPSAYFELYKDITLTDSDYATSGVYAMGWQPVQEFTGTLLGNGYAISNLKGTSGGFIRNNKGTIDGVRFVNVQLTGSGNFGAIVCNNYGTITRCYANLDTHNIENSAVSYYIGGICSYNNGTVSYCTIDGKLKIYGPNYRYCWLYAGAISGCGLGHIYSCYSDLDVIIESLTTTEYVYYGGISQSGYVSDCRNDGTVHFNVYLDYNIYANAYSTDSSTNCYGSATYTAIDSCKDRVSFNYGTYATGCYTYKTDAGKYLESSFPKLDFEEKWMITADGPMPQGVMDATGSCYVKTDYRRPACADGYTKCVDQNGKINTITLPLNGDHLGGVATCTQQAVCELCNVSYGAVDPNNHSGTESVTLKNDSTYPFTFDGTTYTSTNKAALTTSEFTVTALTDLSFTLDYTVSSEQNYDKLTVKRNGTILCNYSGEMSGSIDITMSVGDRLYISYYKDISTDKGKDQATFTLNLEKNKATCTHSVECRDCNTVVAPAWGHDFLTGTNDATYPFACDDRVFTSTNKDNFTVSTYTFTAQQPVTVTVNYTVSSYENYHYMRILKNSTTLYSVSGEQTGTYDVVLNKGDTLKIRYDLDKYGYGTVPATKCVTFYLTQQLNVLCTDQVVCATCNKVAHEATGHKLVNHAAQAATCTEIGWNAYKTCENCAYTTYAAIAATGHSYVNHEAKSATCTEIGWAAYRTCEKCDYTTYTEIAAKGHSYGVTYQNDASYPFSKSGDTYTSTNKADNTVSVYTVTANAPCTVTIDYTVSSEATYDKLIIMKNGSTLYTYSGEASGTVTVTLSSGDKLLIEYSKDGSRSSGKNCVTFTLTVSEPVPTCTESVVCNTCSTIIWAATGHSYQNHVCLTCNFREPYLASGTCDTGLSWSIENDGEMTITGSGIMADFDGTNMPWYANLADIRVLIIEEGVAGIGAAAFQGCTNLTTVHIPESVAAVGADAFAGCTALTDVYYAADSLRWLSVHADVGSAVVHYGRDHTHTIINHEAKEPTCAEIGWEAYETCRYCDYTTYEPLSGHEGQWIELIPVSCTVDGLDARICTLCGYTETLTRPAHGHSYSQVVTTPTCTQQGYTTKDCDNCGDHVVCDYVDALGHTWSPWETIAEPTCSAEGSRTRSCFCGVAENETLEKLAHTYSAVVTAPTCTQEGYTTKDCSVCGYHVVEDYVDAKGHGWSAWITMSQPTCTTEGSRLRFCNCGVRETEPVAKLAHSLDNGICTSCGYTMSGYVVLDRDMVLTGFGLTEDLYIDLNGYSLSGTIITNGYKIYGMDSTTDTYSCAEMGVFSCVDENGAPIVPVLHFKADISGALKRYISIETEEGYTFHRIYLGITKVNLKPSVTGFGYKARFCGDEMVLAQLDSFGFMLQLEGNATVVTQSLDGASLDISREYVLTLRNFDVEKFGEHLVYAQVFLEMKDGTRIESAMVSYSMKTMLQLIGQNLSALTQEQLQAIKDMCTPFINIVDTWNIRSILN